MNQIVSIGLYITIILLTTLFTSLSTNKRLSKGLRILFAVLVILVPSIFAGLRYGIGTDYQIHKSVFNELESGLEVTKRTEMGYLILNKIIIFFGGNYQCLLFIISFITVACIYKALLRYKDKINVTIGILSFMLLYYQMSYNLLRQMLAISIMIYALKYLENKKSVKYIISCIIATTIHSSSIIFLFLLVAYKFLSNEKYKKILFVVYIVAIVLVFNYPKILNPILQNINISSELQYYLNYLKVKYQPIGFGICRYILLFIIPGILIYKRKRDDNIFLFWYNTSVIGFIFWTTSYVTERELYRISYNFLILIIFLLGFFWKETENKKYKLIYRLILLILLFFFWYYDYFYLGANGTVPYMFCF